MTVVQKLLVRSKPEKMTEQDISDINEAMTKLEASSEHIRVMNEN